MQHELIQAWRDFYPGPQGPHLLEGDNVLRARHGSWCCFDTWNAYVSNPTFASPNDRRFHLGLIPVPFIGNLGRASVFVLLLNPGLGPHDYYAEYEVPAFRAARIANLRQRSSVPFLEFQPEFSWHGGFRYWHSKLAGLIFDFSKQVGASFSEARAFFQSQLAAIQLVPYHSATFALPNGALKKLVSVQLAKSYVHEILVPRARARDCIIVVARAGNVWGLQEGPSVVRYNGAETRSAHLSLQSRGGAKIAKFLRSRLEERAA
jgi:hypothetical protein